MREVRSLLMSLRRSFLLLDLRGKITVALLGAVMSLGGVIMLSSYLMFRHQLIANTQALLESNALVQQRAIELKLTGVIALADSLASNPVTANALADSRGRETYLAPLLQNQRLALAHSDITVVDYRGRYAASTHSQPPDYSNSPSVRALMSSGRPTVDIDLPGQPEARLVVALPIVYRLSNNVEGAVVLRVLLSPLLDRTAEDSIWISDLQDRLLAGHTPTEAAFTQARVLSLPAPLEGARFKVVLARDRASAFHALDVLLLVFTVLAALVFLGVLAFSRWGARLIAQPLAEIAVAAEQIAASGRPVALIPVERGDEFGRLSAAFNMMVERLRLSYAELENRVLERTREYEQSRLQVERTSSLLREAVQNIAVGFTIYDENDRLVMCNDAYQRFYAQSRDLLVPGARFEDILRVGAARGQYGDLGGEVDAWVAQRIEQHRQACGQVIEQRLGDGRWLLIVEHRTPSGYSVGNRIDITEFKRTAEALRESEERWELAVRGANDGVWDWDIHNEEVFYSDRSKTMLGYSSQEISHTTREWLSRIHPQDRKQVLVRVTQHLCAKTDFFEAEYRLRCKDGSYKWILSRGKVLLDEEGKPIRMSGSNTDITERRLAEARLRDRTEQLNAIFALSPDGFVSFDGARRVQYVSPAFGRMTALDESEVVGLDEDALVQRLSRQCSAQSPFPTMDSLRATQLQTAPQGHERQEGNAPRRQLIEMSAAGKRVLEVGVRLSDAESVSQILYLRDVTHEIEVDRMKSEFLSTAAHELRTPMASIFGFSELLISQRLSEAKKLDCANAIHRQSRLMISIVNELLDLARIDARRGKDFNFAPIELHALLNDVVASFKAPDQRDSPQLPTPGEPCMVKADADKLTQAIGNVLSNAYKYSPGGGAVEIDLILPSQIEDGARIGLRITDHGIGLTPEQLLRVSERFYRADTTGKIPGTGLGMSIVKEIIELHGGEMTISSTFGEGTAVTLWLPAH